MLERRAKGFSKRINYEKLNAIYGTGNARAGTPSTEAGGGAGSPSSTAAAAATATGLATPPATQLRSQQQLRPSRDDAPEDMDRGSINAHRTDDDDGGGRGGGGGEEQEEVIEETGDDEERDFQRALNPFGDVVGADEEDDVDAHADAHASAVGDDEDDEEGWEEYE